MVILVITIGVVFLFYIAYLYDQSLKEETIPKTFMERRTEEMKNKIRSKKEKMIRERYGID